MKPALTKALSEIQIPPDDLEVLVGTGDDQVLYCTLPGDQIAGTWELLSARTEQTGYAPIIIGHPDEIPRIRINYEQERKLHSPADVLAKSAEIDPKAWLHSQFEEDRESLKNRLAADADFEWPVAPEAVSIGLRSCYDYLGTIRPKCILGLVPTKDPNAAPAYLLFGDYNACPETAVHVAMLRHWNRMYGCRLACISGEVIEMTVGSPPQDREEALKLAFEQYIYCNDIVDQGRGHVPALAVELWQSPLWYFWWD